MATARRSPVLILLLLCALPAFAQVADPPPPDSATAESSSAESKSTELPKPRSGCGGETPIETEGIDTMRAGLERGVCSTARFVDGLFGGDREFAEYDDEASGRASVTVGWNEQDHAEVDTRFRASVNLPQINERFNATIGKASSDEYIADEIGVFNPAVGAFSDDDPAEWFAGVGYRAHRTRDSRFDLGAGVKLESPLNPYANARYRRYIYPAPDLLLTLRTTFFAENDEGFGVTQAFDVDKILEPGVLVALQQLGSLVREDEGNALALPARALPDARLPARDALRGIRARRDRRDGAGPVRCRHHAPALDVARMALPGVWRGALLG